MHKYTDIPSTLDEWKNAAKKEILWRAQIKAEMPPKNQTGMPYPAKPFQRFNQARNNVATGTSQPRYVPMDVDAVRLGGPLTAEERKRLFEENRCFYCRDKGHRANRCWKKPNNQRNTTPPVLKETNPFRIRATTMDQTLTPPAAPPSNDQGSTPREQITTRLKNLSKDEYNNLLNEMMTEDF